MLAVAVVVLVIAGVSDGLFDCCWLFGFMVRFHWLNSRRRHGHGCNAILQEMIAMRLLAQVDRIAERALYTVDSAVSKNVHLEFAINCKRFGVSQHVFSLDVKRGDRSRPRVLRVCLRAYDGRNQLFREQLGAGTDDQIVQQDIADEFGVSQIFDNQLQLVDRVQLDAEAFDQNRIAVDGIQALEANVLLGLHRLREGVHAVVRARRVREISDGVGQPYRGVVRWVDRAEYRIDVVVRSGDGYRADRSRYGGDVRVCQRDDGTGRVGVRLGRHSFGYHGRI